MSTLLPKKQKKAATLATFIHHPVTDIAVMLLIVISVVLLVIEEMFELPDNSAIAYLGDFITVIFLIELTIRYRVAKKKGRFFRRYWADIIALLPLLRPLRFFRFFRLMRVFRLFHLGVLLDRRVALLRGILRINFYFLWALLVVTAIVVIGGGVIAFLFEGGLDAAGSFSTIGESVWWAAYTVIAGEPVGDMPQSPAGRILLVVMMLGGMTLFAVFTGIVSATMIERLRGVTKVVEMDIEELESHIVVCGWNAGTRPLLSELSADDELRGLPVVMVNELERLPELGDTGVRPDLIYHLHGDFTQLSLLEDAGVVRAARAVVMADDVRTRDYADRDARSVLAALTIERLNPEIYCVVELMNAENESHLGVAGVEAVIMRNDLSGRALAAACRHPNLMQVMMNLLSLRKGETIHRLPGPQKAMSFDELHVALKKEHDALLIGIERDGRTEINPSHSVIVRPDDYLVVIGGPVDPKL